MFFINAGRVVAYAGFGAGILHIGFLLFYWERTLSAATDATQSGRFPLSPRMQEMFNEDLRIIVASIAIGILSEIGKRLVQIAEARTEHGD